MDNLLLNSLRLVETLTFKVIEKDPKSSISSRANISTGTLNCTGYKERKQTLLAQSQDLKQLSRQGEEFHQFHSFEIFVLDHWEIDEKELGIVKNCLNVVSYSQICNYLDLFQFQKLRFFLILVFGYYSNFLEDYWKNDEPLQKYFLEGKYEKVRSLRWTSSSKERS